MLPSDMVVADQTGNGSDAATKPAGTLWINFRRVIMILSKYSLS
jgi:hypothetical protein